MLYQEHLIIIGVAAGLMLSALLRFMPTWRELLAGILAASLIDYAINSPAIRKFVGGAGTASGEIPFYPHVCPCVAVTFIGILAVLHALRG